jgi:hypothetical protein
MTAGRRCGLGLTVALNVMVLMAAIALSADPARTLAADPTRTLASDPIRTPRADPTGTPGAGLTSLINRTADSTQVAGFVWPAGTSGLSYTVRYALSSSDFCQSAGTGDDYASTPPTAMPAKNTYFDETLTGLEPDSVYCVEIVALQGSVDVADSGHDAPLTQFTAGTPNVTAGTVAGLAGPRSDTLNANINPAGAAVSYTFEWAPRFSAWCTSEGTSGTATPMPAGHLPAQSTYAHVTGTLSRLSPGQYYCAGVSVTNATGTTTVLTGGETNSGFMGGRPSVSTGPASDVSPTTARLGFRADTDADPTAEIYVQWRPVIRGSCTRASLDSSPSTYEYADANLRASTAIQSGALATRQFAATDPGVALTPRTRYCYMAELASDEPNPFEQNDYFGAVRYFTTR